MKIAILAPSPVPFSVGGAEKLWRGLHQEINQSSDHQAELIKLPSPEHSFWDIIDSYEQFSKLDLTHFDLVISGKYPAWMTEHPNHVCYMLHRLRGFYDCFHFLNLPDRGEAGERYLGTFRALLLKARSQRTPIADVFTSLRAIRQRDDLPEEIFQFPGSFCRDLVRFFDDVALQQDRIKRFAAISRTVAARKDYFPKGVVPRVIYPPSNLKDFRCERFDYIFTASRLDAPKRIDLAINAMKFVKSDIELRICGEGPEKERLQELAGNDARIRFLGYRSDASLINDYANAAAIIFTPYDEDYGLITVEAMMSGKPVITTTDAGGPNEFVTSGENGFCVAPDPEKIAERIEWIAQHRDAARVLGNLGRQRVQPITWNRTASRLLQSAQKNSQYYSGRPSRKLTVATTFPIVPVRGGGQARIFHLYKNLFPSFQTEVITLAEHSSQASNIAIAPGLREIRIPKSKAHAESEVAISAEVEWFPVTDLVFPQFVALTPRYLEALDRSCRDADVVVASHPYVFQAIETVTNKPIWYEAQDIEYLLKKGVIPKTPRGLSLIEAVLEVERRCCEKAALVMACSKGDKDELVRLYNLPEDKVRIVPNGVDTSQVCFISRERCLKAKRELGVANCFSAVFIGSWHKPNLQAIGTIMYLAEECADVRFLILGSSCLAFERQTKPANLGLFGVVDDMTKDLVLRTTDIALNPMQHGSGTNLKMLEYAAAGVPIITTSLGMRGLGFKNEHNAFVEEISDFAERIESLRRAPLTNLQAIARHAREHVRKNFNWRRISGRLLASL
jgi:glycosyltransferase involved in cell wall biosynthesis